MRDAGYLLDVNVLVALTDRNHVHHAVVTKWFDGNKNEKWGTCPLTEGGFLRVVTNPAIGALTIEEATEILIRLAKQTRYIFWPITQSWVEVASQFEGRVFGHQQVTDACLLGLAIKEGVVLVTLDKAVRHLAGAEFQQNLLVLE